MIGPVWCTFLSKMWQFSRQFELVRNSAPIINAHAFEKSEILMWSDDWRWMCSHSSLGRILHRKTRFNFIVRMFEEHLEIALSIRYFGAIAPYFAWIWCCGWCFFLFLLVSDILATFVLIMPAAGWVARMEEQKTANAPTYRLSTSYCISLACDVISFLLAQTTKRTNFEVYRCATTQCGQSSHFPFS